MTIVSNVSRLIRNSHPPFPYSILTLLDLPPGIDELRKPIASFCVEHTLVYTSRSLDKLADKVARIDRVALADRQVADLSGVRSGDDHFMR